MPGIIGYSMIPQNRGGRRSRRPRGMSKGELRRHVAASILTSHSYPRHWSFIVGRLKAVMYAPKGAMHGHNIDGEL